VVAQLGCLLVQVQVAEVAARVRVLVLVPQRALAGLKVLLRAEPGAVQAQ